MPSILDYESLANVSKRLGLGRSFIRYCLIAALSFSTNLGLTALLHEVVGTSEETAFAAALVTVFVMNFLFMRYWIYEAHEGSAARQGVLFILSSLLFRGAEYAAFVVVHTCLGANYLLAIVAIEATSVITKFFYYRVIVFRTRRMSP